MSFLSYVHDLDPVIFQIGDAIAVRWYGLAYVLGFVAGYIILRHLSRKRLWNLPEDRVADFVTYVAIFGVMLGARLGYLLFYTPREHGWSIFAEDPLIIFRVWEGGMSSHGGMIGVVLFTIYYAYRHKLSWVGLLDGLCIVAPVGIFFGRIANFINGELYGRVTEGVKWSMKFPLELGENRALAQDVMLRLHALNHPLVPEYPQKVGMQQVREIIEANRNDPRITEVLEEFLPERHPSQLYEAFAEGLLIFIVLYTIRILFPKAREGLFSGLFCLMYAVGRIMVEYFRQPDAPLVGEFTMGQFLSFFLILVGCGLLIHAWRGKGRPASLTEV